MIMSVVCFKRPLVYTWSAIPWPFQPLWLMTKCAARNRSGPLHSFQSGELVGVRLERSLPRRSGSQNGTYNMGLTKDLPPKYLKVFLEIKVNILPLARKRLTEERQPPFMISVDWLFCFFLIQLI